MFVHAPFPRLRRAAPSGFTLVELLVVITVAAILLGIAVPALQKFISSNQLLTITDNLVTALNEARSEAVRSGTNVSVSANSGTVDYGATGWKVQATVPGPGNAVLRAGAAVPPGYTVLASASLTGIVTFDSTGRLPAGAPPGSIMVCQGTGPATGGAAQMIMVASSGRIRVAQNDANGWPIDSTTGASVATCMP